MKKLLSNELGCDYICQILDYKDDYNFSEKDYFFELIDSMFMILYKFEIGEGKQYLESIEREKRCLLICYLCELSEQFQLGLIEEED